MWNTLGTPCISKGTRTGVKRGSHIVRARGLPLYVYMRKIVYPIFQFLRHPSVGLGPTPAHVCRACDPYVRVTRAVRRAGCACAPDAIAVTGGVMMGD